jgi:deoxyhypusine synthase
LLQVHADATIILPLLISQTFAKHWVPKTGDPDE